MLTMFNFFSSLTSSQRNTHVLAGYNPVALVEQSRLTPAQRDLLLKQAELIATADSGFKQQQVLARMGFQERHITHMLAVLAEAQAQDVALTAFPTLQAVVDEMSERLHLFEIINMHRQNTDPDVLLDVSRCLKEETLQAALRELVLLVDEVNYIPDREITALDTITRKQEELHDLSTGLVVYLPFNENADDVSGNGNHGVAYGARLIQDRFGRESGAFFFDGNDEIKVINPHNLPCGNGPRSVCAWVYPMLTAPADMVSYGDGLSVNKRYSVMIKPAGEGGQVGIIGQGNDLTYWGAVPNLSWKYICSTHDGTNSRIYIDGVEISTGTITFDTDCYHPLMIGTSPDNRNSEYFVGIIDDFRAYNRSISAREVEVLYQGDPQDPAIPPEESTDCDRECIEGWVNIAAGTLAVLGSIGAGVAACGFFKCGPCRKADADTDEPQNKHSFQPLG